jgi:hypothetical protein
MSQKQFFTKIKAAREVLRDKADKILEEYLDTIQKAKDMGDYQTATKALQWLIEHMPEDEHGQRMIDAHVDKTKVDSRPSAPSVQIGIQLGGVGLPAATKELPEVTVEPIPNE